MVQFYVEKLGETLCQLGIDTDKFGIRYQGKMLLVRRIIKGRGTLFAIKKCIKIGNRKYTGTGNSVYGAHLLLNSYVIQISQKG